MNLIALKEKIATADLFTVEERDLLLDAVNALAGDRAVVKVDEKLLRDAVKARQLNEHMLATLRKLYDDVRAEQARESEAEMQE